MANTYFRFKQFTINHDRCAMKVGTDGVLLGAWTDVENKQTALDVGSGTGLVSLMLAQRNQLLRVDALEIDTLAFEQSLENVQESPFVNRVFIKNVDFKEFVKQFGNKYDLIVSNPPFFNQSQKCPQKQRTTARHNDTLSPEDLIHFSARILSPQGKLVIIYPYDLLELLLNIIQNEQLFVSRQCLVFPTVDSEKPKRVLLEISLTEKETEDSQLILEKERHVYTSEFFALTNDFYLDK